MFYQYQPTTGIIASDLGTDEAVIGYGNTQVAPNTVSSEYISYEPAPDGIGLIGITKTKQVISANQIFDEEKQLWKQFDEDAWTTKLQQLAQDAMDANKQPDEQQIMLNELTQTMLKDKALMQLQAQQLQQKVVTQDKTIEALQTGMEMLTQQVNKLGGTANV